MDTDVRDGPAGLDPFNAPRLTSCRPAAVRPCMSPSQQLQAMPWQQHRWAQPSCPWRWKTCRCLHVRPESLICSTIGVLQIQAWFQISNTRSIRYHDHCLHPILSSLNLFLMKKILPLPWNIRHSNTFEESKFFKFDQIFKKNHKNLWHKQIYYEIYLMENLTIHIWYHKYYYFII